jgi:hypothetical protein
LVIRGSRKCIVGAVGADEQLIMGLEVPVVVNLVVVTAGGFFGVVGGRKFK